MKQILRESKLGIDEGNIANILSQTCLLTNLTIRGKKGSLSLDRHLDINQKPQCLIDGKIYADMTDEEKAEVEAYRISKKIRTTFTSYIPKSTIDKINSIQGKLRTSYYDACSGPNYMTTEAFENFHEKIDESTKELDTLLEVVENNWNSIMHTFKDEVLKKYPYLKEIDVDKLIKTLGSGSDFRNSYSIKLEYTPIPNSYSIQGLNVKYQAEAEKKVNENAMNDIANMIGSNLNSAYQALNRLLISNKSLQQMGSKITVASKTKGSIMNLGVELDAKLGFLKIDSLDELIEAIGEVSKSNNDDLIYNTECTLATIYAFMKEKDLKEYLNLDDSVLTEEMLEVYI